MQGRFAHLFKPGNWQLFAVFKSGEESKDAGVGFLGQGYYDNDYVKIDGMWYISTLRFRDTLVAR